MSFQSKFAFQFSSQSLAKSGGLYLWTFTLKDLVPVKEVRVQWNYLLTLLKRRWPNLCGVRVYEMHKRHGLHIHLVTNRFLDVNEARKCATSSGWGRIHVKRINPEIGVYLSKYLCKKRPECLKGWRLWSGFGNWAWTKCKDVEKQSPRITIYRTLKTHFGWEGKAGFFERMATLHNAYMDWLESDPAELRQTKNYIIKKSL